MVSPADYRLARARRPCKMQRAKEASTVASVAPESVFDGESFIHEYYLAWSGMDEDRILAYYADNVVLQIPGTLMEGKEALRNQFVRPFITAFPGNRHLVKNMIFAPGVAIVEFDFQARHQGPFAGHAATDVRVNVPGCGVYEYDSAKRQITAARIYYDVGTLLQTITELPENDRRNAAAALQLNERNLTLIINTIPTMAWTTRSDGYCDFLNQRWLDYAGMTADQAAGWGWTEAIHPDDHQELVEYWQSSLASGLPIETEGRMRRFDGSYRWFLFRANAVRDESGQIVKWYGTNLDIEDRKRVEEGLRAVELSWRQIVDNIPGLVATMGPTGEVEFLNRQTLEYFGKTNEDLKNWSLIGAVHPDDLPRVIEARQRSIEVGQIYEVEHRCRRADGVYRWFQVRGLPVRNAAGATTAWYLLLTDIDDRKKAEEALRSNERNLSLIINTIPTHIYVLNTEGFVQYVNQAVMDYTGLSMEDVQQEDYRDRVIHPEDFKRVRAPRAAGLRRGAPFSTEQRVLGNDEQYRWFLVRYNPLLDDQGRIDRWYVTAFDIEDRKQLTEELRRSEAFLAEGQRLSRTGSFCWRVETDEITWSEEAYRIFQFEPGTRVTLELIGSRVYPEDQAKLNDMIERARKAFSDFEYQHRLLMPDASVKYLHLTAHGIRNNEGRLEYIGAIQDVTESKVAEEALTRARSELAHMARVTTLSALTASIAHEINQPLFAAITSAGACLRWLNRDEPEVQRAREAAMRIEEDGRRAAEIITNLKAFYRKDGSPQRETVSVSDVVGEMLVLLRSEADRHLVVMRTELAAELPSVSADRVQLQQVLMNLMLNGMEAMGEQGGELTVSTRREGEEVMVSIIDTGVGIPAEKMQEIFNEFFTTKAGGTGMGLAISSTIIESHGGRLWATANPGGGATFHFTLPTEPEAYK
jgi:PAS domain S-box-containing protein